MVIYDLKCGLGHQFEGWFSNSNGFERQIEAGIVSCSVCGDKQVRRIVSLLNISSPQKGVAQDASEAKRSNEIAPTPSDKGIEANIDPVHLMKAVQHYVKTNFKDVGDQFADKAIKMHQGEETPEPIYGTANEEQKENLEEVGVSYTSIPKLPEEFEN